MSDASADLLSVEEVTVDFPAGRGRPPFRALDNVSLTIAPGETLGLVGESGSGKTTLGLCILGLVRVTSGRICFDGRELTGMPWSERRKLAGELQVVFQDPTSSLNPVRTIGRTLAEPLESDPRLGEAEKRRRITAMLDTVGLPSSAVDRYPVEFSGGQRQRIAIARALIASPRLVICDEPVSALDLSVQAQIVNLLADLQEELSISYLFVSHDLAVVRHLSTRVAVLFRGELVESGPAETVCTAPTHPYTRSLLDAELTPAGLRVGDGITENKRFGSLREDRFNAT